MLELLIFIVGFGAALLELEYIVFQYSKKTLLVLRIASAMQAAGAALLVFNPLLCGGLLAAGLFIFSSYNYSRREP